MPLELAFSEFGQGEPLAILHGLFGSGRNWATIAKRLGESRRVLALDLRNHGSSPWADDMGYAQMAEDVTAIFATQGIEATDLIGHSMGGRTAMVLALTRPQLVRKLVVVDIPPAASSRGHLSYVRAMRGLDLGQVTRRKEADDLLAEAVPDVATRMFLLQNLVPEENRGLRWRINLAAIESAMDDLTDFPHFGSDARFEGPTLFVTGAKSDYVRPEHRPEIERLFPNARTVEIADAGHWVHAEQPESFLDAVSTFLDEPNQGTAAGG